MKDILVKVDSTNSQVFLDKAVLSNEMENLQGKIRFQFINGFVDGIAMLETEYDYIHHLEYQCVGNESGEYEIASDSTDILTQRKKFTMPNDITPSARILYYTLLEKLILWKDENTYVELELSDVGSQETVNTLDFKPISKTFYALEKEGESYYIPIYNTLLLKSGRIYFNIRINSDTDKVFKSNIFYLEVLESINAINGDIPKEYSSWIDVLNNKIIVIDAKLEQIDQAIAQTNNLDIDVSKEGKTATVEITKKTGTTKSVDVLDGTSLMFQWQGTSLGVKTDEDSDYVYVDLQGVQGEKGDTGAPFTIKKTYTSVAEMNADFDNMEIGDYVMIASSVEIEDNAKLYTKGQSAWIFITDFSGATGIQGETGATPNIQIGTVITGNTSGVTRTGTNENPVLNFVLERGEQGNSIEFNWNGTQLGVRVEGESQYEYVDLKGATGNGISSIEKTSTSDLVDTYTVTYTNGNTDTIEVTNGKGIASISKTSTSGYVDTYTITYNDGTTSTYEVTNGEVSQAQLDEVQEDLQSQVDYYKTILNALPKVTGESTELTLNNTANSPMEIELKPSELSQDGTPTPSNPQTIHKVTGNNEITITNSDNTKSQLFSISLGDLEYCGVGNYSDRIFCNTPDDEDYDSTLELNKWYLKKNIRKKIWDNSIGTSGGGDFATMKSNGYICRYSGDFPVVTNNDRSLVYCNRLKGTNLALWNGANGEGIQIGSNTSAIYLSINFQTLETYYGSELTSSNVGSAFNSYFSNNNTEIYFPTSTPTYILLNNTLQEELDNIDNWALSYNAQTNITQTNADLPFVISASAIRDMSDIFSLIN